MDDKAFRRLPADERLFPAFLRSFLKRSLSDVIDVGGPTLEDVHRGEGRKVWRSTMLWTSAWNGRRLT